MHLNIQKIFRGETRPLIAVAPQNALVVHERFPSWEVVSLEKNVGKHCLTQ